MIFKGIKIIILTMLWSISSAISAEPIQIDKVLKLDFQTAVNNSLLTYLERGFLEAKTKKYDAILIKMDTPGGLVSVTKSIITLFGKSDIPVIVWVAPEGAQATSAGAIVSSASHFLFMSDASNIGAATPIMGSGKNIGKDLRKKAINSLVATVKSNSEARGRNGKYFELMIREAKSYTAKEAVKKNIANGVASSFREVVNFLNDKKVTIKGSQFEIKTSAQTELISFDPPLKFKVFGFLSDPDTAYIFFLLGALLLYLELQVPGGFVAGSVGAVFLALGIIGMGSLPLNFSALALIGLSLILFVLELFITSFGILAISGLVSLTIGSLFLFEGDDSFIELSREVVFGTVGSIALFGGTLTFFIVREFKKGRLVNELYSLRESYGRVERVFEKDLELGKFTGEVTIKGKTYKAICKDLIEVGDEVKVIDDDSSLLAVIIMKIEEL